MSVSQCQAGDRERQVWVRDSHQSPLVASLAVTQGKRERERERETAPSTSPLTYISSVVFFHSSFSLHLLFLLYQQLHNCDVMTKVGVMEAQAGPGEDRQTEERDGGKRRRQSETQTIV